MTMPLTNGCHNNDVIQLGSFRSQSFFHFVQISDACFVHLLFQLFPTRCNHLDSNVPNVEPTLNVYQRFVGELY